MYTVFINGEYYTTLQTKPEFPLSSAAKLKIEDNYYVVEKVVHCLSPELNLMQIQIFLRKQDLFYESTKYLG